MKVLLSVKGKNLPTECAEADHCLVAADRVITSQRFCMLVQC